MAPGGVVSITVARTTNFWVLHERRWSEEVSAAAVVHGRGRGRWRRCYRLSPIKLTKLEQEGVKGSSGVVAASLGVVGGSLATMTVDGAMGHGGDDDKLATGMGGLKVVVGFGVLRRCL